MAHAQGSQDTGRPIPESGLLATFMFIVRDLTQSSDFYVNVLGAELLQHGPPTFLKLSNAYLTLNTGGGPTEDKPAVTAAAPENGNVLSAALNLRVADIHATHALWKSRGARFFTDPIDRGAEIRCYLTDPDGYLIELGQSK